MITRFYYDDLTMYSIESQAEIIPVDLDKTTRFFYYFFDSNNAYAFSNALAKIGIPEKTVQRLPEKFKNPNFGVYLTAENVGIINKIKEKISKILFSIQTTQHHPIHSRRSPEHPLEKIQKSLSVLFEKYPPVGHALTKENFKKWLTANTNSTVTYIEAKKLRPRSIDRKDTLDPKNFWHTLSNKLESQIKEVTDFSHTNEIHLFSLPSRFNGAPETPRPFIAKPGKAMESSDGINTQGVLGLRTNPILFEAINAFLVNGGFNQLSNILPKFESKLRSDRGYLLPNTRAEAENIASLVKTNWEKLEQPCVSTLPIDRHGDTPVYLMLGIDPTLGAYFNLLDQSIRESICRVSLTEIEYHLALANFTAQFNQALNLATDLSHAGKTIIYHPTEIGLSIFTAFKGEPSSIILASAFKTAALDFQHYLTELNAARIKSALPPVEIKVQFEISEENPATLNLIKLLELPRK